MDGESGVLNDGPPKERIQMKVLYPKVLRCVSALSVVKLRRKKQKIVVQFYADMDPSDKYVVVVVFR